VISSPPPSSPCQLRPFTPSARTRNLRAGVGVSRSQPAASQPANHVCCCCVWSPRCGRIASLTLNGKPNPLSRRSCLVREAIQTSKDPTTSTIGYIRSVPASHMVRATPTSLHTTTDFTFGDRSEGGRAAGCERQPRPLLYTSFSEHRFIDQQCLTFTPNDTRDTRGGKRGRTHSTMSGPKGPGV
jgi:hypothetical protein